MQQGTIGMRVRPLGINKLTVADDGKCRCVLIDPNPKFKYTAYDENLRRCVEVDQDLLIRYNLRPTATFYYLVAKLNTDMMGRIVSDDFTIEYLKFSENINNEFSDAVSEMPSFTSIAITKEKKSVNGKDYSFLKPKPSGQAIPNEILSKVRAISQDQIDSMWAIVDRSTSITPEEYISLREGSESKSALPSHNVPALEAPAESTQPPYSPTASDSFNRDNGFGTGDDFSF